ncbi:hypothetical protein MHYP_G00263750 [Metynnis hypsauchen]
MQRRWMFGLLTVACILVHPSAASVPAVKVNLHDSATLPCSGRCSGLVRWTEFHNPSDVLAECNQTSCRSKEGYQMTHDQYLKGNLSLTITNADFSKRGWYTCQCDDNIICDVSLRLEPPQYSKKMYLGESLTLDLPVSEPVKVTFNRTGDLTPNPVQLGEVKGCKIRCDPAYEERVEFQSGLVLKDLKDSDDGIYTLVDAKNEEIVSTYKVTVRGEESWIWKIWEKEKFGIGLGVGVFLGVLLGFIVTLLWKKRKAETTESGHS